jgi:hypothetical protein
MKIYTGIIAGCLAISSIAAAAETDTVTANMPKDALKAARDKCASDSNSDPIGCKLVSQIKESKPTPAAPAHPEQKKPTPSPAQAQPFQIPPLIQTSIYPGHCWSNTQGVSYR